MYLMTPTHGLIKPVRKNWFKRKVCRHKRYVTGTHCSSSGLMRISGEDTYMVCLDCGEILAENHTDY